MNDEARRALEFHAKICLKADGMACQKLAETGLSVEEGWPELMRIHAGMLVANYAASLTIYEGDPHDPAALDRFDWDMFLKMVENMCRQQLMVLRDEMEREYGKNHNQ